MLCSGGCLLKQVSLLYLVNTLAEKPVFPTEFEVNLTIPASSSIQLQLTAIAATESGGLI